MNTGLLLKMKSTNRCSLYAFPPKAGQTRANTRDASAAASLPCFLLTCPAPSGSHSESLNSSTARFLPPLLAPSKYNLRGCWSNFCCSDMTANNSLQ